MQRPRNVAAANEDTDPDAVLASRHVTNTAENQQAKINAKRITRLALQHAGSVAGMSWKGIQDLARDPDTVPRKLGAFTVSRFYSSETCLCRRVYVVVDTYGMSPDDITRDALVRQFQDILTNKDGRFFDIPIRRLDNGLMRTQYESHHVVSLAVRADNLSMPDLKAVLDAVLPFVVAEKVVYWDERVISLAAAKNYMGRFIMFTMWICTDKAYNRQRLTSVDILIPWANFGAFITQAEDIENRVVDSADKDAYAFSENVEFVPVFYGPYTGTDRAANRKMEKTIAETRGNIYKLGHGLKFTFILNRSPEFDPVGSTMFPPRA